MTHQGMHVEGLADLGRTAVMGILNVTPDSFSDGGRWFEPDAAVAHGMQMVVEGADIVDVGGESTRPGALRPGGPEEIERVLPVITALAGAGCVVSVDTMRAEVAAAALSAGARIVNDVSGGLADPEILRVVAPSDAVYIAMHWRAHSARMADFAQYDDVVSDVCRELGHRRQDAVDAGIEPGRIILDPGLGFAKRPTHNWSLLRGLSALGELGAPVLVGASRKSFLGSLLGTGDQARPVLQREAANTAITTLCAANGVWGVRVHDVRAARDAIAATQRWEAGR